MSFELKEGRIFNPFFFFDFHNLCDDQNILLEHSQDRFQRDFREFIHRTILSCNLLCNLLVMDFRPFPHFTQGDFVLESSCQFRIQCGRFSLILQSKVCAKIISLNCRLFVLTSCTRCLYVHGNFGGSILQVKQTFLMYKNVYACPLDLQCPFFKNIIRDIGSKSI